MSDNLNLIFWLGSSFAIGLLGALLVANRGFEWGLADTPSARSSHLLPVPKGGGAGILSAFFIGALWWHLPWTLWIPACVLALVSMLGDYRDISFKIRLAIQIGTAAVFSSSIFLISPATELSLGLSILLFVFAVCFISASANFYNFMDGINGIAGMTGMIAFTGLGLYGFFEGKDLFWVLPSFGIAAACVGFLPLNFPRAKVFMGDVGSILLGFLFASWVLLFSQTLLEFVVLVSFLFPFYIDELSTLIVRIKDGDRLTKAHRRHIYQILVNQAGFSHAVATVLYGFFQIIVAIIVWIFMKEGLLVILGILAVLSGLFFILGLMIRRRWEMNYH